MKRFWVQIFIGFLGFLFLQACISSCIPADIKGESNTVFFDLKGFLDKQISYLTAQSLTVHKIIQTTTQKDSIQHKTKDVEWQKEFAFFYNADINTPTLRDSYSVEKTPTTWKFEALQKDLKIQQFKVDFENQKVKEIYIIEQVKNHLFDNQRILTLQLQDEKIVSYAITTSEHMQLMEENNVQIQAIIRK